MYHRIWRNTIYKTNIVIIKKIGNNCLGEDMEKWEPLYIAGGDGKWYATLENSLAILHKVKHRVNTWPGNSTPMYTAKRKKYEHIKTCPQMFIAVLFIIAKKWKHLKCLLINDWINKM